MTLDRDQCRSLSEIVAAKDAEITRLGEENARLRLPPELTLSEHPGCAFCMETGTPVRLGEVCPKCNDRRPTKAECELREQRDRLSELLEGVVVVAILAAHELDGGIDKKYIEFVAKYRASMPDDHDPQMKDLLDGAIAVLASLDKS